MEAAGGQLTDWNFELRGAQSWITDEARWDYQDVKVSIPGGQYNFNLK
jgi:D-glycero-alpha-D-manno-heptose-7-phosphate kinase